MYIYFKAPNDINASYKVVNDMVKKTSRKFYTRTPLLLTKWLTGDENLSKLLPLLQFTLRVVTHFLQLLNTLYFIPITLIQVLQILIIFLKMLIGTASDATEKTLLTLYLSEILESIFTKIKRGSWQKPDTVMV